MKDTYYFQHDYNPTSDPKIQALIGEHGAVGYGLYWRIVEMLHEEGTHKLPCKKYIYLALAKQMSTSVEQVEIIVKCCIELCELFVSDNELFWSERVLRNIEKRTEISNKRSEAGKKSAELRKISTSVEQVSTSVQQNPTKESKVKEIKVKEKKEKKEIKETISKDIAQKKVDAKASTLTRRDEFYKSLIPFLSTYGKDMIRDFFDYWSEQNKSGTQMRFEKQPTWEVAKRLATWNKRDTFKNQNNGNTKIQSTSSREAKEQSRRNLVKLADQILGIDESEDNGRSFR